MKIKLNYIAYQNVIFAMLLICGAIKYIFSAIEWPFDITLLFSGLITVDIIYNLAHGLKKKLSPSQSLFTASYFLLFFFMVLTLFYTRSESYGFVKTLFFPLNIVAFIYPLFLRKFVPRLFFITMVVPLVLASIWFLISKYLAWYSSSVQVRLFFKTFKGSYLLLSNAISFCVLYYVHAKKYRWAIALFVLVIALGGRGPLIFLILLLLFWKFKEIINVKINMKILKRVMFSFLGVMVIVGASWKYLIKAFKFSLYRITSFIDFEGDTSAMSRFDYISFSFDEIFGSIQGFFIGFGIGSFGVMYDGIDQRQFPHNIFIEAWFELGLIGLFLTIILFIFPIIIYRNKPIFIRLMCVFFIMHALKSGSFDGMRFMSGVYGMLIFLNYEVFNERVS